MTGQYCYPEWFCRWAGIRLPDEGREIIWGDRAFVMRKRMLRDTSVLEDGQRQTRETFAFKWKQTSTYASDAVKAKTRSWLVQRYGDWNDPRFWDEFGKFPCVLDAGCGSGLAAHLLIGESMHRIRYIGIDVSDSIDVAAKKFSAAKLPAVLVQTSVLALPFRDRCFDVVLSEGVFHHTPSPRDAIRAVAKKIRIGGKMAFYVYRRKAPTREFTDDHVRRTISRLTPEEAWNELLPLTKLGKALGELNTTVNVPDDIAVLGIPQGPISLQRLFYWYFCKMFYSPEYTINEMNHVNFDWFAPTYAHRHSVEEVSDWCDQAGLQIENVKEENAGITVSARVH